MQNSRFCWCGCKAERMMLEETVLNDQWTKWLFMGTVQGIVQEKNDSLLDFSDPSSTWREDKRTSCLKSCRCFSSHLKGLFVYQHFTVLQKQHLYINRSAQLSWTLLRSFWSPLMRHAVTFLRSTQSSGVPTVESLRIFSTWIKNKHLKVGWNDLFRLNKVCLSLLLLFWNENGFLPQCTDMQCSCSSWRALTGQYQY